MLIEDKIIECVNHVFKGVLPNFAIDGFLQVNGRTVFGDISNTSLIGSKFHRDFVGRRFLHFTSLKSLKGILETGSLKLSNFNTFKDKKEYLHASEKIFEIPDDQATEIKKGLFVLSLTELQEKDVKNNYDEHWKNYGNESKGVALEFEILRQPAGYFPLAIQYYDSPQNDTIIAKLKECHDSYFTSNNYKKELACFFYPLFCAYKENRFKWENETRIFFNNPNLDDIPEKVSDDSTQFYIDDNNYPIYYQDVPLIFPTQIGNEHGRKFILVHNIYVGKNACYDNISSSVIFHWLLRLCRRNGIQLNH